MLLGTLAASILRNTLTERGAIRASEDTIKFETQNYYQNQPKFNSVFSRNNLSKIKDGAYTKNLDEYESIGTHWIGLYVNDKNVTCFESFGVEYIPNEVGQFIENNIIRNIYRIQVYDSIKCRYFCIGFIDFMLKR